MLLSLDSATVPLKMGKKEAFVLEFINTNNFILAELWQLQRKWLGSFSKDRINVWAKVGICARRSEYFREQSWKLDRTHYLPWIVVQTSDKEAVIKRMYLHISIHKEKMRMCKALKALAASNNMYVTLQNIAHFLPMQLRLKYHKRLLITNNPLFI